MGRLPVRRHSKLVGTTVAVDTETTGLRAWHGDCPFMISFCDVEGNQDCFSWYVDPARRVHANDCQLEYVRQIMESEEIRKVFHNAKFDVRMLERNFGIRLRGPMDDTMFMAHVCKNIEPAYGLKELAARYLGIPKNDEQDLQKAVTRCRAVARKMNKAWASGKLKLFEETAKAGGMAGERIERTWDAGGIELGSKVQEDYWLPAFFDPHNRLAEKYCLKDTRRTMLLWGMYSQVMEDDPAFASAYADENRLWYTTYNMETRGVPVRLDKVREETCRAASIMERNLAILREHSWPDFNPNSDPQRIKLFTVKLGFPPKEKTPTGNPQINNDFLGDHRDHPAALAMLRYTAAEKAKTSFFDIYENNSVQAPVRLQGRALRGDDVGWVDPETGCELSALMGILHPDFQQMEARTFRYSCRQPNMQNVANALSTRQDVEPIQARTPFVPRPGYRWYSIDYSQLEVRIFAVLAKEPFLLEALKSGRDLHTECGNKAWGGRGNPAAIRSAISALELNRDAPSSEKVAAVWKELGWKPGSPGIRDVCTKWMDRFNWDIIAAEASLGKKGTRAKAKMLLFLKVFGGGPKAAAKLIKCSYEDARDFLGDYDVAFPGIEEFQRELIEKLSEVGYIVNAYGRKLFIEEDKPYKCINYLVQSSAACLIKRQMIRLEDYLQETGLDASLILTIHDEVILEIHKEHSFPWLLRSCKRLLEDHEGHFEIDLPVDIKKCSETWVEKKPVVI